MDNAFKENEVVLAPGSTWSLATDRPALFPVDAFAPSQRSRWGVYKRGVDIVGSMILIAILSPLFALIASMLFLGGGNVIFQQERIGKDGFLFKCYKFRTMVSDADSLLNELLANDANLRSEWVRTQKLSHDPRITKLGRFLRRTSLDELPQLFNVLRGDMSLVGPRPIVLNEIRRYGRAARWYLSVRPGMTGLWQVSRNAETDYPRRVAMDIYYVRNQSITLDILILMRTIKAAIQTDGVA